MRNELNRTISISQAILSLCGGPPPPCSFVNQQALVLLRTIASSGIPRIDDSRVAAALNSKLHALTEEYFRKACLSLQDLHADMDVASLRDHALKAKAAYTRLYEQQVLRAASMRRKPRATEKQPYANDILLYAFAQSQTPSRRERERLAGLTGMTIEQVRVWFQNRRSRLKKKAPEVQSRSPMPLSDLLQRVAACSKAAIASNEANCEASFEEDYDSGYQTDAGRTDILPRQRMVQLSAPATTLRSFPAIYVPQQLTGSYDFDPPTWTRTSTRSTSGCTATVTVDELALSMSRLTLRHRRRMPASATTNAELSDASFSSNNIPGAAVDSAMPKSSRKAVRKEHVTGRRIAGGRRLNALAPQDLTCAVTASPQAPLMQYSGVSSAIPSELPAKARKKPGPPRRKPVGKALSRQASNVSVSSTTSSSSDSSRSTSYASDFSFSSVSSDFSLSSLETTPASFAGDCIQSDQQQVCFGMDMMFVSSGQQPSAVQPAQLPVYDFSDPMCNPPVFATPMPDAAALFDDQMLQLLQQAQTQQFQQHSATSTPMSMLDQPAFDVGVANMDALLDLSSAPFPTLEALLSDNAGVCSGLSQQQQPSSSVQDIALAHLLLQPSNSCHGSSLLNPTFG
uniref:Homeodomain protein HD2 n=1 Tax=Auricularia auricula-judae TaxID=29892 RepID=A0A6G8IV37_AURAJ|nr:homeodomain protein HD2 [Auricularia auricula-judae]QKI37338.1 homeodomain protein HD2 [Auricularia auricula-judae]